MFSFLVSLCKHLLSVLFSCCRIYSRNQLPFHHHVHRQVFIRIYITRFLALHCLIRLCDAPVLVVSHYTEYQQEIKAVESCPEDVITQSDLRGFISTCSRLLLPKIAFRGYIRFPTGNVYLLLI